MSYRATPEQWAQIERWAAIASEYSACLIELRARVEALEEAENDRRFRECSAAIDNTKQTPNLSQIRSSLVERVAFAIDAAPIGTNDADEARAAILEVAAWLSEHAGGTRACWLLEREAER